MKFPPVSRLPCLNILLLLVLGAVAPLASGQTDTCTPVEIIFPNSMSEGAAIIWGLNGWQLPDSALWPEGSILENEVVKSPMLLADDSFRLRLCLPPGDSLAWGLLINANSNRLSTRQWKRQPSLYVADEPMQLIVNRAPILGSQIGGMQVLEASGLLLILLWGMWLLLTGIKARPGQRRTEISFLLSRSDARQILIAVAVIAGISLLATGSYVANYRSHGSDWELMPDIKYLWFQFYLGTENVASVWFSSMLFFLIGMASLGTWLFRSVGTEGKTGKWLNLGWIALALLFFAMSADEMGSLHEKAGLWYGMISNTPGDIEWVNLFVLPGILILGGMLGFFWINFRNRPLPLFLMILALLSLGSVLAQEQIEVVFFHRPDEALGAVRPIWQLLLEEGTELFAGWCFLAAFLIYLLGSLFRDTAMSRREIRIGISGRPVIWSAWIFLLVGAAGVLLNLSKYIVKQYLPGGDSGMIYDWFPAVLAFLAVLGIWQLGYRRTGTAKRLRFPLSLGILMLSMYYGAAFRHWYYIREIAGVNAMLVINLLLLTILAIGAWRIRRSLTAGRERWLMLAFLLLLALAFFAGEENSVNGLDVFPFVPLLMLVLSLLQKSPTSEESGERPL